MSIIDKLVNLDEMRVSLKAANEAGMELARENAELTAKVDNLTAENLRLAQQLGDALAQVDIYRDAIGAMLDVADELHRIAKAHER